MTNLAAKSLVSLLSVAVLLLFGATLAAKPGTAERKKILKVSTQELEPMGFASLVMRPGRSIKISVVPEQFNVVMVEELRSRGYNMVGYESLVFQVDRTDRAKLLLGGSIDDLSCWVTQYSNASMCHAQITWEVFDTAANRTTYSTTTRAFYAARDKNWEDPDTVGKLMINALRSLLTRPGFVKAVSRKKGTSESSGLLDVAEFWTCKSKVKKMPAGTARAKDATLSIETDRGIGAGVIISPDGYALTALHVIQGAREVRYRTGRGERGRASVLRTDKQQDMALIKLDMDDTACMEISSVLPGTGEELYLIGSPMGDTGAFSVSKGVVSGTRTIDGAQYIQTDASANPGNSGGPMISKDGRLVGIVNRKVVGTAFEGISFGTPAIIALAKLSITPGKRSTIPDEPVAGATKIVLTSDPSDPVPPEICTAKNTRCYLVPERIQDLN